MGLSELPQELLVQHLLGRASWDATLFAIDAGHRVSWVAAVDVYGGNPAPAATGG